MLGRTIGRYRILDKLGEGAMGSVWRAEDPLLGRQLALKFLPEAMAESAEARRRFLREARAASALNHPGIATVFDAGEVDDLVYIAMFLVEGETLRDRLARGPLTIENALAIARDGASALQHAHDRNVIHRDISPRNLMLGTDGRAVLVDFGLALPLEHTRLTQTGYALGTASYMSPEVVQGGTADARSDLYGLGAVLYEMLTGRPPFVAERVESILYATVRNVPAKPSRWRESVPEAVDRLVLKLIEKDPERRYGAAKEVQADLDSLLHGTTPASILASESTIETTATVPIGQPETPLTLESPPRTTDPPLRTPWALWLTARRLPLVLALVLAGVLTDRSEQLEPASLRLEHDTRIAVLPLRNLSSVPKQSAHVVDGIGYDVARRLGHLTGLTVTPWSSSRRYDDPSLSLLDIATELDVRYLVAGTFEGSGDRVRVELWLADGRTESRAWAETFEAPQSDMLEVHGRMAAAISTHLRGSTANNEESIIRRAPTSSSEAFDSFLRGRNELAVGGRAALSRALAHLRHALEADPAFAQAHATKGVALVELFFLGWGGATALQEAEQAFERSLELAPGLPAAIGGLARVYFHQGKGTACVRLANEVLESGRQGAEQHLAFGLATFFCGLPEDAIAAFERVLELDPRNTSARWFVAQAHFRLARWEQAADAAIRFFADFGPTPRLLNTVGRAYSCLGEQEEGEIYLEQALRFFQDTDSDLDVLLNAAELYDRIANPEEALRYLRRGLSAVESRLAAESTNYRMRAYQLVFLSWLGENEPAADALTRYIDEFGSSPGALVMLATMQVRMRNPDAAAQHLRNALREGAAPDMGDLWEAACFTDSEVLQGLADECETARRRLRELLSPNVP